jgi:hypothetical protein
MLKATPYLEYLFHLFFYGLFVRCFAMLCLALSCFWVRQKSVTCNGVLSLGEKGKGVTSGILGGEPAGEPRAEGPRMPGDAEDAEDAEDARGTW